MASLDEGLTPGQVQELQSVAASRRVPQYVSERAAAALEEHYVRTGIVRTRTSSPRRSARWYSRYRHSGIGGLEDAPRAGRPVALPADTVTSILSAPLYADSLRWTTRSIAVATATTQSAVARAWKRAYEDAAYALGDDVPRSGLRLDAAGADEMGSVLVLRVAGSSSRAVVDGFMRSAVRPALQTVLAVDLAAASVLATETVEREASGARGALLASLDPTSDGDDTYVLCTSRQIASLARSIDPRCVVTAVDRPHWQGMLVDLGTRFDSVSIDSLTEAQQAAMRWAAYPDTGFMWIRRTAPLGPAPARRPPASLATADLVAEAVVLALVDDISAGRLGGGDRITETHLTRATHATRGQVRDALKVLASRGIIELEPHRGAVVPTPTVEDVVETYAARRALGALLVRRAAEVTSPASSDRLRAALDVMLATAEHGDAIATGDEDFKLQDAIADISGMRRVPAMFAILTSQLRLFVAVLRLRYGYSIPAMCQDDAELVELITDGDAAGAVQRWNVKMNDAATYMLQQLELRDRSRGGRA